jgi:hypothetical protein
MGDEERTRGGKGTSLWREGGKGVTRAMGGGLRWERGGKVCGWLGDLVCCVGLNV